jgi:hypothetical protein
MWVLILMYNVMINLMAYLFGSSCGMTDSHSNLQYNVKLNYLNHLVTVMVYLGILILIHNVMLNLIVWFIW